MVDVPENIGLVRGMLGLRLWNKHEDNDQSNAIAYTRSDLVAELAAENERLKLERDEANADRDRWYESSFRATQRAEALSRTGAVKIKPLEWRSKSEWHHFAVTILGTVTIKHYVSWEGVWHRYAPFGEGDNKSATLEEAKAAAQADYERRILSALEPAAPEGWSHVVEDDGSEYLNPPSDWLSQELSATEGEQPVAWRLDYPLGTQWCDDKYALQVAVDEGGAKVTPLYARPPEQAVTEAMVEAFQEKYREFWKGSWPDSESSRELLKAAMEAGR